MTAGGNFWASYTGVVATLVRVSIAGNDVPVIAHDGRSDRQHCAGFALYFGMSNAQLESIIDFCINTLMKEDSNRWVAIYHATEGSVLINRGYRNVVHGFKPVKNYTVLPVEEFLEILTTLAA